MEEAERIRQHKKEDEERIAAMEKQRGLGNMRRKYYVYN